MPFCYFKCFFVETFNKVFQKSTISLLIFALEAFLMSEDGELLLLFTNVNVFNYVNAYMLNLSIIRYGFTNHEEQPVIENGD